MALLEGTDYVALEPLVRPNKPGRQSIHEVEANISFIIADVISKEKDVLDHLRQLQRNATNIKIESSLSRVLKGATNVKDKLKTEGSVKDENLNKELKEGKYELYYNFSASAKYIKPHQVLALNRGENLKVLSIKVVVPDWLNSKLRQFCYNRWLTKGYEYPLRQHFFEKSFKDAVTRLIHPLIARQVRASLNQEAERAAVDVFATNLKNLLLSPPLRGKTILAIDPGFTNGCKVAVISSSGSVLETDILYINNKRPITFRPPHLDDVAKRLKQLLQTHNCDMVGLGNGMGCRETEEYLSHLIQQGWFQPLDVRYMVVSEQGASIYSCSDDAVKEFPNLHHSLIGAVSLARRMQDPLSEMVKVEPKHLGVGMYQHDINQKLLSLTLDEVVSECVSFVGVDINTTSLSLLKRIAGLNQNRASKILEWRDSNGPYTNRQQLRLVKGIGDKTYEQCAGFIRIMPQSIQTTRKADTSCKTGQKKQASSIKTELDPLDQTWIHPESYSIAHKFMQICGVNHSDIGTPKFIEGVKKTITEKGLPELIRQLNTNEAVVQLIAEAFQKSPDDDLRSELSKPLFRRGITSLEDLKAGAVVTGKVQNVTHFGTFVDIGVGSNGLIPASRLRDLGTSTRPQLGDRVEVCVVNVELERKRICLDLVKVL